ncbi:hypothetical protein L4D76_17810 [Photobacterium sagamiensis]|uniref:hypothetical protein n=1 Tax=Photobacterium sagamiensis TaxID=2910241 RepID=UPI003D102D6F
MLRPVLIFLTLLITACGGSDGDTIETNSALDELANERHASVHFVNTANQSVDYFVKETDSSTPLFDDASKVATNNNDKNEINQHPIRWSTPTPLHIDLGIGDTNTQTGKSEITDVLLNNSDSIWAIAWLDADQLDGNQLALSSFTHTPQLSNQEGMYSVRVFTHTTIDIRAIASYSKTEPTLEKGEISNQLTVESCSSGLSFKPGSDSGSDYQSISLCDLDPGKLYLLVTDGNELLIAAEIK